MALKTVAARRHGVSAFVVYLGLDADPDRLGIEDYGAFILPAMNTERLYESTEVLGPTRMQASICLNRAIPECSPPGTTIVSMTTLYRPEAWAEVHPGDYHRIKTELADAMIHQFEEGTGARIRDSIEEIAIATPATFARYTGAHDGVVYGYEPDPWDSILPRVGAREAESYVDGLEFAGGFSFMCHGYSSSILSGRAAALGVLRRAGRS